MGLTPGSAALQELKELISSYQGMRESGRAPAICSSIIETSRMVNLDRDVQLPDQEASELSLEERDNVVGQVYRRWALRLCMHYKILQDFGMHFGMHFARAVFPNFKMCMLPCWGISEAEQAANEQKHQVPAREQILTGMD